MTLEDLLRAAVEKGLTHFSVYPVHSNDRKTVIWAARATPSTNHSFVHAEDYDVIKAVTTVLDNLPSAKLRKQKKITVTVNPHPAFDDFDTPAPAKPPRKQKKRTGAKTHPALDDFLPKP